MSFWKILAGVAGGIAVAPFIPIAGPVGAVTIAGAALGGSAGGLVGAVASARTKSKVKAAHEAGRLEEAARFKRKMRKMLAGLKEAEKRLKDDKDYFNLLLAMTAMGMATANADGKVSAKEHDEIDEFVAGIGHTKLPAHVKSAITRMRNTPPTFNTAMRYVQKVDEKDWPLFEEVIKVVIDADDKTDKREVAFLEAWRRCANE